MSNPLGRTTDTGVGSARRRLTRSAPVRRALALSVLGVAAVILAACGGSSASNTASHTSTSTTTGTGRGAGAGGGRSFPGTTGTIAAINGSSLEVQSSTSQTTVTYTSTTTFEQTTSATVANVTVGSCISAFGKPTSGSSSTKSVIGEPVTATTVTITQPTSGTCTGGFGAGGGFARGAGGAGGAGGPGGGGGFPGGGERPGGGNFPARAAGEFGAASGPVTAVSPSTVTVTETNPSTKKTSSVVVTLTSATTYSQRTPAAPSDLAVGKCATAIGQAGTTGAVTARSISISTPGANGCTSGFGRFGGGAGGGVGGGAGA